MEATKTKGTTNTLVIPTIVITTGIMSNNGSNENKKYNNHSSFMIPPLPDIRINSDSSHQTMKETE